MNPSLTGRLVMVLLAISGATWLVTAVISYYEGYHEIEQLFDAQLAQSARVLLNFSNHELREELIYREGQGPGHEDHDAVDVSGHLFGHRYEHKLAFQVWVHPDALALRSVNAPEHPLADVDHGYREVTLGGQRWRTFSLTNAASEITVHVGGQTAVRDQLASDIALRILVPVALAMPVLAILTWLGVGRTMRPLHQVAADVGARQSGNLQSIATPRAPREVLPLIDALNALFERLHRAFENERRFTADASHELRTPLAGLKAQAEVALLTDDSRLRDSAIGNMIRGVNRMSKLVENMLLLARLDHNTAREARRALNLVSVVDDEVESLADPARAKALFVNSHYPDDGNATVNGYEISLAILVRNLLENAMRYTPECGVVDVAVSVTGDGAVLRVADSGPGISPEEYDAVFERFYRRRDTQVVGSGLGLSIVHRIAQLHQADVRLSRSALGGLQVEVSFPPESTNTAEYWKPGGDTKIKGAVSVVEHPCPSALPETGTAKSLLP